jgi:Domain of unknown function (DUF4105)
LRRAAVAIITLLIALVFVAPASAWSALALWFRLPGPEWVRGAAAGLFVLLSLATIVALFTRRRIPALAVFTLVFAGLLLWWSTITPPKDGDWLPDVARQTTGKLDGEILTLSDVRDFDWRSEDAFTERWQPRSYDLSKLETLDLFLAHWSGPEMAHVIMSFGFADGQYLAWSVEVRREKGSDFSPVADAFRRHTIIYLATTERDSIHLRATIRHEDVRLYRLNTAPDRARLLLLEYVAESNALAERPRFFNSITANCATTVFKLVRAAGGTYPLDWRLIINGFLPGYLYDHGAVDTSIPLDELIERAKVGEKARAAGDSPDFSRLIRVGVPAPRPASASGS